MTFRLLDGVVLLEGRPGEHLAAGAVGTIVLIHTVPTLAYEVEFCDGQGATIAQLALLPSEIALLRPV